MVQLWLEAGENETNLLTWAFDPEGLARLSVSFAKSMGGEIVLVSTERSMKWNMDEHDFLIETNSCEILTMNEIFASNFLILVKDMTVINLIKKTKLKKKHSFQIFRATRFPRHRFPPKLACDVDL